MAFKWQFEYRGISVKLILCTQVWLSIVFGLILKAFKNIYGRRKFFFKRPLVSKNYSFNYFPLTFLGWCCFAIIEGEFSLMRIKTSSMLYFNASLFKYLVLFESCRRWTIELVITFITSRTTKTPAKPDHASNNIEKKKKRMVCCLRELTIDLNIFTKTGGRSIV